MVALQVLPRIGAALRAVACIASLALAGGAAAASPGLDAGQRLRLTPEQRRDMWERMSPEQRDAWRGARSQDERQRAWEGLSPDQRRDMWERLSPEQREMMLRRLPPEQRRDMWRSMSPDERHAMRHRFTEQRPSDPGAGPPPRSMHQMSPEERQRLREQIREAQRDVYRGKGNEGRR
jgi:Mg/Co/Ni transporter MgtE